MGLRNKKEEDVMEEVNLRQFWRSENGVGGQWGRGRPENLEERWEDKWEDSVPGIVENDMVIDEEVAMTAGVGGKEEGEVSMRWALDSGASKHIASDIRSFVLLNRVREGSSINTYSGRLSQGWVWLCCSSLARFVCTTYSRLPRTA